MSISSKRDTIRALIRQALENSNNSQNKRSDDFTDSEIKDESEPDMSSGATILKNPDNDYNQDLDIGDRGETSSFDDEPSDNDDDYRDGVDNADDDDDDDIVVHEIKLPRRTKKFSADINNHLTSNRKPEIIASEAKINKKLTCSKCGMRFANMNDKWNHRGAHSGDQKYECDKCGKTFKSKGNLSYHIRNIHENLVLDEEDEQQLRGMVDGGGAGIEHPNTDMDALFEEKPEVELKNLRVFHCRETHCKKVFISTQKLANHMETEHPNLKTDLTGKDDTGKIKPKPAKIGKRFPCPYTGCVNVHINVNIVMPVSTNVIV
ncbi:Zinc finger protein 154 [Candida maltosa Xu316]|uniref:pH-response transcription factor pacC/RIM101 n=1 Tax=Candida maltosa (strain Xu316) TaxID=1245528 RepID=M3IJJ5_CANMX|nr:Zinc finger protein 154 [Candida maltosa Xu316]